MEPLLQLVNHESPNVRHRVAWILGKTKNPRAFEAILKLTEDPDDRVAYDAIMALGELKDERAVPHLFRLINENLDHPEDLDGAAVMALAKLRG